MSDFVPGFPAHSRAREPKVFLLSPRPGQPLDAILLGNLVLSREVHFDRGSGPRGKDVPCLGLPLCLYCRAGMGTNIKTFLSAARNPTLTPFVLQLSEGGAFDLEQIVAKLACWRGLCLLCTRKDKRKESRMQVISKGRWEGGHLPAESNPIPHIERTWGMTGGARTDTRTRTPRPSTSHTNGRT